MKNINLIDEKAFNRKRRNKKKEATKIQDERKHLLSQSSSFFIREAYKTMRTNVGFSLTDSEGCKVIVVTSSLQSEGKSITAANLAISFAEADKRVLLVDCDLRRPKLSRLFRLASPLGLSNLLLDPSLIDTVVLRGEHENLDVISSGEIPPNPSELLGSVRMKKLLQDMRKRYDYIILDTPPINMVIDAAVIAPETDGVLFVVRSGVSERGAVIHAVEQLEYVKVKILGFVLNGIDSESSAYRYSKYRNKSYSYRRYGYYGYRSHSHHSSSERTEGREHG